MYIFRQEINNSLAHGAFGDHLLRCRTKRSEKKSQVEKRWRKNSSIRIVIFSFSKLLSKRLWALILHSKSSSFRFQKLLLMPLEQDFCCVDSMSSEDRENRAILIEPV